MADITVTGEYVTVKDKATGNVIICEFYPRARIETMQDIKNTKDLNKVEDGMAIPKDGVLEKYKIYITDAKDLLCPKKDVKIDKDTILTDTTKFELVKPLKPPKPIEIKPPK